VPLEPLLLVELPLTAFLHRVNFLRTKCQALQCSSMIAYLQRLLASA
jgi:hypothetical protein